MVSNRSAISIPIAGTRDLKQTPEGLQNFMEYAYEFLQDIAKNQIGEEEYRPWVPYVSTVFLFIFGANWAGALIPWKLISLPEGELAAPTNDINVTVALALLTSFSYFYAGLSKKELATSLDMLVLLLFFYQLIYLKTSQNLFR